jgi:beta-phosphoglucomutase-like phosphatase (HAD superfamily)
MDRRRAGALERRQIRQRIGLGARKLAADHQDWQPLPDPLPYLTALERTGASAVHSLAFEDSLSGVRAAAAAGLAVVGMMTTLDSRTLIEAGATFAASNFTDPRIFELIETRLSSGAEEGAEA